LVITAGDGNLAPTNIAWTMNTHGANFDGSANLRMLAASPCDFKMRIKP
jgi:hypothetical protein